MALSISRGRLARPVKVVLYGPEGVGKTTLAAQAPGAVFIDCEGGTDQLDVARIRCHNFGEIQQAVALLTKEKDCQTLVLDTVDWIEQRIAEAMLAEDEKKSLQDYGFGKGPEMVAERLMQFLTSLNTALRAGKNIILLAHSIIKRFTPPDSAGEYDRYELKLSKKGSPLVKEWADALLFLNFETKTIADKDKRTRAIGGNARIILCNRSATHDAKNRFALPDKIKGEYSEIGRIFAGSATQSASAPEVEPASTQDMPKETAGEQLAASLADIPEALTLATAFLISKREIKADITELSEAYAKRALENFPQFLAAIGV